MIGERGDPRDGIMVPLTRHMVRRCNHGTWRISEQKYRQQTSFNKQLLPLYRNCKQKPRSRRVDRPKGAER